MNKNKSIIINIVVPLVTGIITVLATFYFNNRTIDYEHSLKQYENSMTEEQLLLKAQDYYIVGEYIKAIQLYTLDKINTNPVALNNLGYMYEKGIFVNKDIKLAKDYYHKAYELGGKDYYNNWFIFNVTYPDSFYSIISLLKDGNRNKCLIVEDFLNYIYQNGLNDNFEKFNQLSYEDQIKVLQYMMYERTMFTSECDYYGSDFVKSVEWDYFPTKNEYNFLFIPQKESNGITYYKAEEEQANITRYDGEVVINEFVYSTFNETSFINVNRDEFNSKDEQ